MRDGARPNTGGARPGAGRPKGAKDRLTPTMAAAVAAVRDPKALLGRGLLPLDYLL